MEEKIKAVFEDARVIAEDTPLARSTYDKSRFGELKGKKFIYSLAEAFFLMEKGILVVHLGKKVLDEESFIRKAKKTDKRFLVRYHAFKDMRSRGYIVKTALKFGADFRVYDRGVKPGDDHAKWIMYAVSESENFTWHEFSAKNRVAHSTRKNLLIAIIDDEDDVTYYQISWTRP